MAETNMDAYRPCPGDVIGVDVWEPGNRKVVAVHLSERALDGWVDDPTDTVTFMELGRDGWGERGPYTVTYDRVGP